MSATNDAIHKAKRIASWFVKNLAIAVVSSLIVGWISFQYGQKSLSTEVADGIGLLELDSTSESLERIDASFDHVLSLLEQGTPYPVTASLEQLTESLEKLSKALASVKTTESYSVEELKALAKDDAVGYSSEFTLFGSRYDKFMKEHIGKTKRTVEGLAQLHPRLEIVRERVAKIALQLNESPIIDISAMRIALSEMKMEAGTALSSFNSGRKKTLATLERFGKKR